VSERGQQRTSVRIEGVALEVVLVKASRKPREAQHDVRRVVEAVHDRGAAPAHGVLWPCPLDDDLGGVEELEPGDVAENPAENPAEISAVKAERVERGVWREVPGDVDGEPVKEWVDLTDRLAAIDAVHVLDGLTVAHTQRSPSIPRSLVRDHYYVAPAGRDARKGLALLALALRREDLVAVVRWTKRTAQALGVLVPTGRGDALALSLLELEWPANLRAVPDRARLSEAWTTDDGVDSAAELLLAVVGKPSALAELRDTRAEARAELLAAARAGDPLPAEAEPSGSEHDELAERFLGALA
jgi:hypothetical protein